MKRLLVSAAVLILSLSLFASTGTSDEFERDLILTVEPSIHVNVSVTDCTGAGEKTISKSAGETGTCRIYMENFGNTEYDIELRGPVEGNTETWLHWWFECEDYGDCHESHADSENEIPPEIRDINLPAEEETYFNLGAIHPLTNSQEEVNIQVRRIEEDEDGEAWVNVDSITIITEDERSDDYGPFVAPAFTDLSLAILVLISTSVFALTKIR